ncbi:hypothetical protein IEQ34_011997 [Dendrobium chrysotoxum]|uniref:Uncharacterized protein n=1 Tax=Dendrobium chrysotoxum TaxID=161865 RepID=A0AAV7GU79_DENCH|nr:hypothetical protein IEQ34_011997 [Dendrobium chrysotoxum]
MLITIKPCTKNVNGAIDSIYVHVIVSYNKQNKYSNCKRFSCKILIMVVSKWERSTENMCALKWSIGSWR